MAWYQFLITAVAASLMIIGLIGCVLPIVPGIILTWMGVLFYAILTRFAVIHIDFLLLSGALVALVSLLDYRETHGHVHTFRVTGLAILCAMLGAFLGSVFGIFPGLTVGAMLGSLVGELATGHDVPYFMETHQAKYVGYVGATIVRFSFAAIITAVFVKRVFF